MDSFLVSARKYRPLVFDEVIGQRVITETLENAIINNHLPQALLFTGPRGVGKTTCARILARRINERDFQNGDDDFDFNIFELDAASNNSVDDIRSLIDKVRVPPRKGNYKVYIIDEVHMLSQSAFNAFLKILEEPPSHAIFILATTEKHKIIPTILSRCQIFDFKRISSLDIKARLKKVAKEEDVTVEEEALYTIAQKADGAMRDALSIYDRMVSFTMKNLTAAAVAESLNILDCEVYFKMTDFLHENKIPEVLIQLDSVLLKGFNLQYFIDGLSSHFRDLLVAKDFETLHLLEKREDIKKRYKEQASKIEIPFLISAIEKTNISSLAYKQSKNQRLLIELCLMQIASINFDGVKKKSDFIIPSSSFRKKSNFNEKIESKAVFQNSERSQNASSEKLEERRIRSILSLKNFSNRLDQSDKSPSLDDSEKPTSSFTEQTLIEKWKNFGKSLEKEGESSMASILNVSDPVLNENKILYCLPNKFMKEQFIDLKSKILNYLRVELNNYQIELDVEVRDSEEERYIYTPEEKFQKMTELNSEIVFLKESFDLDI